ncbi:MAG: hypothetical protein CBE48_000155 [Flavobacteriales bacterium TMED288]|nr:hypothetical protein [Flavobacteriales bacterium]RPG53805.1 MAG: hypothetical protein CBE48_000155 [Flavobacteriales bacterium TMED288]|tara:strand:+ start:1005 stop:1502 length:498 start_codon:yes stop_codon:yes gene_type:complete
MKKIFLLPTISILISSCSIYSFSGTSINSDIKTVYIPLFQNKSKLVYPELSQIFTLALQDRFIQQTSLEIIEEKAELTFNGFIKNYEIKPISITSNDQANQNRLQIEIYIEFTNSLDPNKSFNENFMRFADYDSNLNFSDIEVELINEIILELIEDIFNKAFAGW